MRYLIFILSTLTCSASLNAQQLPYFRNEIYAPQWHNPASFGSWNKFSVNALAQHTRLFSYTNYGSGLLSAEGFIGVGKSNSGIGIGISYLYDQVDIQRSHGVAFQINYQFSFDKVNLSIGIAPGFRTIRQSLDYNGPDNVLLPPAGIQTKETIDAGVHVYSDKFYAGLSIAQLNRPIYDDLDFQGELHFFMNGGYRFKISKNIQLFPSVVFGSSGGFNHTEATLLVQFMKPAITFGAGYGTSRNVRGVIGYEFKGVSLLYSIGTNLSLLTNADYFNQEIRLTYKLKKKPKCSTCEHF